MPEWPFIILVAEDNPDDATFLVRAFKANRIKTPVHIVKDGDEAIAYLEGSGEYADRDNYPRPGFLILDLKMPNRTGLEVLQWLKDYPQYQVIPTLVLSSSDQPKDVDEAYRLGASAFLLKPSSPEMFQRMVRIIHEYWDITKRTTPGKSPPP
jgi:CheY-like chemotaxis protein